MALVSSPDASAPYGGMPELSEILVGLYPRRQAPSLRTVRCRHLITPKFYSHYPLTCSTRKAILIAENHPCAPRMRGHSSLPQVQLTAR